MHTNLKVIDFFCGAGGFSEGFRQQGFKIVMGIENWRPAIQTHNLNHGLNDDVTDILSYETNIERINTLPNTEVIIGSPPCVTFSMSNKAGKADKTLGLRLIEAYLRIVTVKKYQPGSVLKAWIMENVPNSRNFVKEHYTFKDLGLEEWSVTIGRSPDDVALHVKNNGGLFTASDYGSPQSRQRFICGEVVADGMFPFPAITHGKQVDLLNKKQYVTLKDIKGKMPSPLDLGKDASWSDPNYPGLKLRTDQLTDHFYDTGLYQVEWEMARFAKVNHPFMGRMAFPEDEDRPSRTVMATRSASTREAIIYRSEYGRKGDGEYRLPTIREAATLMGFPYTYQFVGGESTKWKQIGNAVCPHMSAAIAKAILKSLGYDPIKEDGLDFSSQSKNRIKDDLTNSTPAIFNSPPRKKLGTKFRMHPFKGGNMTVALTNFDVTQPDPVSGKGWSCSIFFGSGKEYIPIVVNEAIMTDIQRIVDRLPEGRDFIREFEQAFSRKIPPGAALQHLLEANKAQDGPFLGPVMLVDEIGEFIKTFDREEGILLDVHFDGIRKSRFPKRQMLAIWAIHRVVALTRQDPSRV